MPIEVKYLTTRSGTIGDAIDFIAVHSLLFMYFVQGYTSHVSLSKQNMSLIAVKIEWFTRQFGNFT